MSIDLDWKIDDDESDDSSPPPETARRRPPRQEKPPTPRHLRRLGLALLLAVVLAVAAGALWLRLTVDRVEGEAERALRLAIELEARAFAEGDEELFLARQDDSNWDWYVSQRDSLKARTEWPETQAFTYTLTVVETHVQGEHGWALVDEVRPRQIWTGSGSPVAEYKTYRRVAFYRLTPSGWLRAAPDSDSPYWGETRSLTLGRYTVVYPAAEEEVAKNWLSVLGPLADEICADLGCRDDLRWTLTFSPTMKTEQNEYNDFIEEPVPVITSPSTTGYAVDEALDGVHGMALTLNVLLAALHDRSGMSLMSSAGYSGPYWLTAVGIAYWELYESPVLDSLGWAEEFRASMNMELRDPLQTLFRAPDPEADERFIPLAQLGIVTTELAAVEGYSVVDYVAERHGRGKLGELLAAAAEAPSLWEALEEALDVQDLEAFQREWIEFGKQEYGGQ